MRRSSRSEVDPFIVMDVMEAARRAEEAGARIIHMEVGQPGTPAPGGALRRLDAAMQEDALGYTVALGRQDLRERIALLYREWYGIDLDPARVIVTAGSSGAFLLAFTALFDAGDRVAIGEPGYPSYRQILKALDLHPVGIQTRAENRYQPVPEEIIALPDLAGMLVASPANPTGTMLDHKKLEALIGCAQGRGISFISDEIYHGIQYGSRAVSALEISDDVCVINSFSKYFSMTGWRVGWMVVPQDMVRTVERLAQNMFICAPHASQVAALGALDARKELVGNLGVYARNREILLAACAEAGLEDVAPPDGAFYIYVDVSRWTDDSMALARRILDESGVAVTPGLDFDPIRGRHTIRLSYAGSTEDIEEGARRLVAFFRALPQKG